MPVLSIRVHLSNSADHVQPLMQKSEIIRISKNYITILELLSFWPSPHHFPDAFPLFISLDKKLIKLISRSSLNIGNRLPQLGHFESKEAYSFSFLLCQRWEQERHFIRITRYRRFFHTDHPPVIFQVETGKMVEKADVGAYLHNLYLYSVNYSVEEYPRVQTTN